MITDVHSCTTQRRFRIKNELTNSYPTTVDRNHKMFTKEPRTCHDFAKPIIYLNFIIGMGAYRQPNISDAAYFHMQVYTIIVNLLKWTATYVGLTGMLGDAHYGTDSTIAYLLYILILLVNSMMAVFSPVLIWLQIKSLKDCFRKFLNLDDTFSDIIGARNDYREQYKSLICHVIVVVLAIALLGISDALWISMKERILWKRLAFVVTIDYPVIVLLVLDMNFCTCVRYLQGKFRDLNDSLLRMAKKSPGSYGSEQVSVISRQVLEVRPAGLRMNDMNAKSLLNDNLHLLHEIREMYLELCKLSRKTNVAFGIQNLLSMGTSVVITTSLLYVAHSSFTWQLSQMSQFVLLMSTAVWISIYVSRIWIVNHSCWNLKIEAERTGDIIYELLETKVDGEFQKEIEEFAVQIIQNPVRFNACGFFTLDHTFVQGVIGSVTTYLVILIQMNNTE